MRKSKKLQSGRGTKAQREKDGGKLNSTLDELGIKTVNRATNKRIAPIDPLQMEARTVHRGPAVTIFSETYYSDKLWPHLYKRVYFFTVQAGQEKIRIYTADKEFICNVEKKKPIPFQELDWTEFRGLDELQKQLDRIERRLDAMKTVRTVESWQSFLKRQPRVVHDESNDSCGIKKD